MLSALENRVLICTILAWIFAQGIKIAIGVFRQKRFDFKWLIGTGGMPSAHAAGVSSLATAIGLTKGFDSGLFALGLVFAVVTMFDAQGVRREAGKQAEVLNKLISENKPELKMEEQLIELLGHTPVEVFAGSAIGIMIAIIYL